MSHILRRERRRGSELEPSMEVWRLGDAGVAVEQRQLARENGQLNEKVKLEI